MGRQAEIRNRRTINVVVDGDEHNELLKFIGPNNYSIWLRDKEKEELGKLRKKEEAPKTPNPLGLPIQSNTNNIDRYIQINEHFSNFEKNMIECIDMEKDTGKMVTCVDIMRRIADRIDKRKKMLFREGVFYVNGKLIDRRMEMTNNVGRAARSLI